LAVPIFFRSNVECRETIRGRQCIRHHISTNCSQQGKCASTRRFALEQRQAMSFNGIQRSHAQAICIITSDLNLYFLYFVLYFYCHSFPSILEYIAITTLAGMHIFYGLRNFRHGSNLNPGFHLLVDGEL